MPTSTKHVQNSRLKVVALRMLQQPNGWQRAPRSWRWPRSSMWRTPPSFFPPTTLTTCQHFTALLAPSQGQQQACQQKGSQKPWQTHQLGPHPNTADCYCLEKPAGGNLKQACAKRARQKTHGQACLCKSASEAGICAKRRRHTARMQQKGHAQSQTGRDGGPSAQRSIVQGQQGALCIHKLKDGHHYQN